MGKVIKRTYRFDEAVDLQSLSPFPKARLPLKFKMPSLDKFNGMSCPVTHLKMYTRVMHPLGADDEILVQLFQNTLTGWLWSGFSIWKTPAPTRGKTFAQNFSSNIDSTMQCMLQRGILRLPNKMLRRPSYLSLWDEGQKLSKWPPDLMRRISCKW